VGFWAVLRIMWAVCGQNAMSRGKPAGRIKNNAMSRGKPVGRMLRNAMLK